MVRAAVIAVLMLACQSDAAAEPPATGAAAAGWWMTEPVRFLQTNINEKESTLDPRHLIEEVDKFGANTFLFNMGGIVAHYPTEVEYHFASPSLPAGRDLFGDVLREAHARGIRVIGRFDLSKTQQPVYEAHPEWFFRRASGEPAIYNGLYSACINGDYYRRHAEVILTEALEKYPVDGLFFNMFGNPTHDYSAQPMGPCQCEACKRKFLDRFGYPLPAEANDDYRQFMRDSSSEVAAKLAALIHRLRPEAAFMTYIQEHTDVIMSEANTSVSRPLPMWPYSASDQVDDGRNSQPGKMAISLCMSFVDYSWRYVTVPQAEIVLRLYQSMAHGGPPALVVVGTMDQLDRRSLLAAQPVFDWHKAHEEHYVGQESAARVMLLKTGDESSYRGFFRLLSEQHIPFFVSRNLKLLDDHSRTIDLVIAPDGAPTELGPYVRRGGRLLAAGARQLPPELAVGKFVERRPHTQGSWRIHDHKLLPSLENTDLVILDSPYVELEPLAEPLLTLIPPAMLGPPEKIWVDKVETKVPGLVLAEVGQGRVAYIPWDVGRSYYRFGSEGHAGLIADVVDELFPHGRQLRTTAHPLVEITIMRQPARGRTQLHLVNMSGHSDTAYHRPVPMQSIELDVEGEFESARAIVADRDLPVSHGEGRTKMTLPGLDAYELIVLK